MRTRSSLFRPENRKASLTRARTRRMTGRLDSNVDIRNQLPECEVGSNGMSHRSLMLVWTT